MSGHVFVVAADATRLACDDVLVPTDRDLRVGVGWLPLLPDDAVACSDADGVRLVRSWDGSARVHEAPGARCPRVWLVDTVGDEGHGLPWLLDGARQAPDAVAARPGPAPLHGRARRLVALPALGTG